MEQCCAWQAPLYIKFIDFPKAFDSINRRNLRDILREYGIPDLFASVIQEMYYGNDSCIISGQHTSEWFKVESGVTQGRVISGLVFVTAVDWIMRRVNNRS